jgi:hypothetical protein
MLPVDTAHDLARIRIAAYQRECRREALMRGPAVRHTVTPRTWLAALFGLVARVAPAAPGESAA